MKEVLSISRLVGRSLQAGCLNLEGFIVAAGHLSQRLLPTFGKKFFFFFLYINEWFTLLCLFTVIAKHFLSVVSITDFFSFASVGVPAC